MVILIGPPVAADAVTDEALTAHLTGLLASMSVRDAAKAAAVALGVSKARAYELALALRGKARADGAARRRHPAKPQPTTSVGDQASRLAARRRQCRTQ